MYSASNAVIEWLLVVKMLETEIHFRYSAIPLFRLFLSPNNQSTILSPTAFQFASMELAIDVTDGHVLNTKTHH